jgi:glycosyltransferase involved in cell wall biosynthesis
MTTPRFRLAFVVGSRPPELCGVGDYTERVADALRARGHDVRVVLQRAGDHPWAAPRACPQDAILHLQYPSVGIGHSVAPLLALLTRRPSVVTVHEFSRAHVLRRAMVRALAAAASAVVCTTEYERVQLTRHVRSRVGRPVIPLGSNIPVVDGDVPRDTDLAYFGLLAPGKGIDEFLFAARQLRAARAATRIVVIGGCLDGDRAAMHARKARSAADGVRWTGFARPAAVSRELRRARVVFLPFPDGASERRGSLLAALAHGCAVVTTDGPAVTDELRRCTLVVRSVHEAVRALCDMSADRREELAVAGEAYAARRTWPAIAEAHEHLYATLRSGPR